MSSNTESKSKVSDSLNMNNITNMNTFDAFETSNINTSKVHISVQQRTGRTYITKIEGILIIINIIIMAVIPMDVVLD
jgi:translation initiation factor 1 (eIF-1/SUI1)